MRKYILIFLLILSFAQYGKSKDCQPCYSAQHNQNCKNLNTNNQDWHMLHMSVHPHLDAFWIFDFESYYDPSDSNYEIQSYFQQNKFSSVRKIFDTITQVLDRSKKYRQNGGNISQKAHRSFFNSQMGFFKRWYFEQDEKIKNKVKTLLSTKYWEIVGGGLVEHDEGCAYYDDIINNFEIGLNFLKNQLNYFPKVAISADSFGHSQSTLAILAHLGIEGYFVQRSDEHILQQKKAEFIWRAKSSNNLSYGALPTHVRWAIHGYQDQFDQNIGQGGGGGEGVELCSSKQQFIDNIRRQNKFLKQIFDSSHIMRYFGHDFQKFNEYSYDVIETFMEKLSQEKCNKIGALYTNPTEYFKILMGEVWNKVKPVVFKNEDIFPIWDYDSGLYWTGYFTTDPYHKKIYRDCGRYLNAVRKAFLPVYIKDPISVYSKFSYDLLERFAEVVSYLQHHDGISGTSKYSVMDIYEKEALGLASTIKEKITNRLFDEYYQLQSQTTLFDCGVFQDCVIPDNTTGDILLKIFNSGGDLDNNVPLIIQMPINKFYQPDCEYDTVCMCHALPCSCSLYLYPKLVTYTTIKLKNINKPYSPAFLHELKTHSSYKFNQTHFEIDFDGQKYTIGYKLVHSMQTSRRYDHLSRFGTKVNKSFRIRSGKYALGNDPKTQQNYSRIRKVYWVQNEKISKILILWKRQHMKTVVTINKYNKSKWKIQTLQAAESGLLEDIYLQIGSSIKNEQTFFTDSNGWLVMKRELFKHQNYKAFYSPEGFDDINGNSYPMTAFAYIKDSQHKLSIHTDRPQGVISPREGILWINIDRLSQDDGKWVFQTTYRNQYQRFTHQIAVSKSGYPQRQFQKKYDQPLLVKGTEIQPNQKIQQYISNLDSRKEWTDISNIDQIKFWIRPWNNSQITLRVQNLDDEKNQTIGLFAGHQSTLLTSFYGNIINFEQIEEMSLGANMKYKQFLQNKWNWNSVQSLEQENKIFNKEFSENITLRPLQIRTFNLKNISFQVKCQTTKDLKYSHLSEKYTLSKQKTMPKRNETSNEQKIIKYLLEGDHCIQESPVLWKKTLNDLNLRFNSQNKLLMPEDCKHEIPKEILNSNYPKQNMVKDIQCCGPEFYQVLAKAKALPKTLTLSRKLEYSIQKQIKNPDLQLIETETKNPKNQEKQKDPKKPEQQKKNEELIAPKSDPNIPAEILNIKQRIQMYQNISKEDKQLYFNWKLQKIVPPKSGD